MNSITKAMQTGPVSDGEFDSAVKSLGLETTISSERLTNEAKVAAVFGPRTIQHMAARALERQRILDDAMTAAKGIIANEKSSTKERSDALRALAMLVDKDIQSQEQLLRAAEVVAAHDVTRQRTFRAPQLFSKPFDGQGSDGGDGLSTENQPPRPPPMLKAVVT